MRTLLWAALLAGLAAGAEDGVSDAHLSLVHKAYLEAKQAGFSRDALLKLYSTPDVPDVAAAVKKLVDLHQSDPARSISPDDSRSLEGVRQEMNMEVLEHLALVTGGTIEVMDAGKQNGIRSDKDLMIFAVLDGHRTISATEMKRLYEEAFREIHGIEHSKLDMTIFDGDAVIPDWRRTNLSLSEYVETFKKGQAKLEQNPGAVREAGTWRQGAELRYATGSRVTLVKHRRDPKDPRVLARIKRAELRERRSAAGDPIHFEVIENAPVAEASARFQEWRADLPYRNAMDAAFEWRNRHNHATDFVDKMKYFNRTVGNGINALAIRGWDKDYIVHLSKLPTPELRSAYIRRMLEEVYVVDLSADHREHFAKVMELSVEIEIDKMKGRSRSEAEYLKPLIDLERKNAASRGESLEDGPALARARERLYAHQDRIMKYNIMATTRQKIRMDLTDTRRLALLIDKYTSDGHDGLEEVRKLQWETWHQIGRIIDGLDDDVLIGRIVSDAPEAVRPRLQKLHEAAKARRAANARAKLKLEKPDPRKAETSGPEERTLVKSPKGDLEEKESRLQEVLNWIGKDYDDFKADLGAGKYSDEAITERLRTSALDMLGYEDRVVINKLEVEFEAKFSGSKLLKNALDLGNVNSLLSILQVYQETGDLGQVAQTALWEVVSNIPGVSQAATLNQALHDGNVEGLTFLFLAWQVPAAGQIKMVFDVAKGSMTLVYNHAMDPLKDDRFSQIYLGYVDAQPAGWSPLKPGWKERRAAAGDSILHFVPGASMEEKRTNLYEHFHKELDARLQRNGIKPADGGYWEKYETILEPFFRKYVHDYFAAEGEWKDNTTVGLRAIGQQEELQDKLARRLLADFQASRKNFEKLEEARESMKAAMLKGDDVRRRAVEAERTFLAAADFLAAKVADVARDAVKRLEGVSSGKEESRIRISAFPPVVTEGQSATVVVRAMSAVDGGAAGAPHVVEVRRIDPAAGADAALPAEEVRKKLGADAAFLKPLTDATKPLHLATVEYEVTVKTPAGRVLGKERVKVGLAGESAAPAGNPNLAFKLLSWSESKVPGNEFVNQGATWGDYGATRVTPWNVVERGDSIAAPSGSSLLFLFARWPTMPPGKHYYAQVTTKGGTPPVEKTFGSRVFGYTQFLDTPEAKAQPGGPCFKLNPLFPVGSVGSFRVSGRLLAFAQSVITEEQLKRAVPIAEFPIDAAFDVPDPPRPAKGTATIDAYGSVGGGIRIENIQPGKRPARVAVGSRAVWVMMNASASPKAANALDLGFGGLYGAENPTSATVTFRDFGKEVTVTAELTVKPAPPRITVKPEALATPRKRLDDDMKKEEARLNLIAGHYGWLAKVVADGGGLQSQTDVWIGYKTKQFEYYDRAVAAAADAGWAGYKDQTFYVLGTARGLPSKEADRPKFIEEVAKSFRELRYRELRDALATVSRTGELKTAELWVALLEKAGKGTPAEVGNELPRNLATACRALADQAFRTEGNLAAARSWWDKANAHDSAAWTGPRDQFQPPPFRWEPDPAFR